MMSEALFKQAMKINGHCGFEYYTSSDAFLFETIIIIFGTYFLINENIFDEVLVGLFPNTKYINYTANFILSSSLLIKWLDIIIGCITDSEILIKC